MSEPIRDRYAAKGTALLAIALAVPIMVLLALACNDDGGDDSASPSPSGSPSTSSPAAGETATPTSSPTETATPSSGPAEPPRPPEGTGEARYTATGLGIIELSVGEGETPKEGQTAVVHYTGWILNNEVRFVKFDSSLDRGTPFEFKVGAGEVIDGWEEAIVTMNEGGVLRLKIPPSLGYGAEGVPPDIPPNSDLYFDIELLEIK